MGITNIWLLQGICLLQQVGYFKKDIFQSFSVNTSYGLSLRLLLRISIARYLSPSFPTPLNNAQKVFWRNRYLLVRSQQWKHQYKVWNLFKFNNKVTRTTSLPLLLSPYCYIWTYFTNCTGFSVLGFEQANRNAQWTTHKKWYKGLCEFLRHYKAVWNNSGPNFFV